MTINWKPKDQSVFLQRNALIHYFAKSFNIDPLTVQLLFERNMDSEERIGHFLFPSVHQFHNPFLLNDMKLAIARIICALKQKEPIIIFGDYDVDGMTSTALLAKALRFFGGCVTCQLPLRQEGYGLSVAFIEKIKQTHNCALIITVDNGSSSIEAVQRANLYGLDVIITDHHEVLGEHPPAYAFINPKRADSTYPFNSLAGVGVALKMVEALFMACKRPWSLYMWDYLEFACVGTVADMMPLTDENRLIVSLGLQKLNNQPTTFFKNLLQRLYLSDVTSSDISFRLAPILNSSGRIDDPNQVVRLLLAPQVHAGELDRLLQIDKKRKQLTESQFRTIEQQIVCHNLHNYPVIVVHGDYEEGIIGILAAKITNKWHKPAIVITANGKASCRGGPNPHFSIIETIASAQDHLKTFGGHKQAAGFSIELDQIDSFQRRIWQHAVAIKPYTPIHWYDTMIQMDQFPFYLWDEFSLLEPFGIGNTKPVFFSPNTRVKQVQYFGSDKQYFKCQSGPYETLSFQKTAVMRRLEARGCVDLLYPIGSHHQFLVEDIGEGDMPNPLLNAI